MNNPWEDIGLETYERHMSLDSVGQLQALSDIMKEQFDAYPVSTAMVLGVAGGNGLGHIDTGKYKKVYGVDINAQYLQAVSQRFESLSGVLECLRADLTNEAQNLPQAQLIIADLLVEYIGYAAFGRAVTQVRPEYVSCVIQINTDSGGWVSESPYIHAFERLSEVHYQMSEEELSDTMKAEGYSLIFSQTKPLPNGKALRRLDYKKQRSDENV
ncbi:MAG: methyltransferase type 11 [Ruminococcus sp.]|nr:methyltransferase type 11 [Ruminococcus sp.]